MKKEKTKDRVRAGRVGKILIIEVDLLKVQLRATVTGIACPNITNSRKTQNRLPQPTC